MTVKSYKQYQDAMTDLYKPQKEINEGKTYWDCFDCEGHGMVIRDNKLVECSICEGDGVCS